MLRQQEGDLSKSIESYAQMNVLALGAGKEVGRSCHLLEFTDKKTVMLDCGVMPGKHGESALPAILSSGVNLSEIELCLVTHFHLDHIAALPYLMTNTEFKGKVYMTLATMAIAKLMLADYVRRQKDGQSLYTAAEMIDSLKRVNIVDFHQEKVVSGVRFTAYHAGHVLGAAMFAVEYQGIKTLYTGDFSRTKDRHLIPAEIPQFIPDVLIIESTCGTKTIPKMSGREKELTTFVEGRVRNGGHCLLPVFSQGRAQEIMLILEEHWAANPHLHSYNIYVIGKSAKDSIHVFQTYTNQMNRRIRNASRPFDFRHVRVVGSLRELDAQQALVPPCVVLASPGFLTEGVSREILERWCGDERNGVAICAYTIQGTLAHSLAFSPKQNMSIISMNGTKLHRRCKVKHISFMAHADFNDTRRFIEALAPSNVVLVHGGKTEVERLQRKIATIYQKQRKEGTFEVYAPDTHLGGLQKIELKFKKLKSADVLGVAAKRLRVVDGRVSAPDVDAVIVSRDFDVRIMAPQEVSKFTSIESTSILQRLHVPFHCTFDALCDALRRVFDDVDIVRKGACSGETGGADGASEAKELRIGNAISIQHDARMLSILLEWKSSSMHDMLADAIVALAMELQMTYARPGDEDDAANATSVGTAKTIHGNDMKDRDEAWQTAVERLLYDQFGEAKVEYNEKSRTFSAPLPPTVEEKETDVVVCVHLGANQTCNLTITGAEDPALLERFRENFLVPMQGRLDRVRLETFPLSLAKDTRH